MSPLRLDFPKARPCGHGAQSIIYAWGRDAPALELPKDVGFRLTSTTGSEKTDVRHLVIQVHYKDAMTTPDASGVAMTLTKRAQKYEAGVKLLAMGGTMPGMTTSKNDDKTVLFYVIIALIASERSKATKASKEGVAPFLKWAPARQSCLRA